MQSWFFLAQAANGSMPHQTWFFLRLGHLSAVDCSTDDVDSYSIETQVILDHSNIDCEGNFKKQEARKGVGVETSLELIWPQY